MLRTSRSILIVAALSIAAVVPLKSADAAPPERASAAAPRLDVPTANPSSMATVLALNSFQVDKGQTMRFEKRDTTDAVDGGIRWSPRTQSALQRSAFDHALNQTFTARDHSPGTFAGSMLDSLVDFAGPANVKNAAKSSRPKPDQYRLLLRAINDRNPGRQSAPSRIHPSLEEC